MYDLYVYLLHSPSRCPARAPMCDKLKARLHESDKFRTHFITVTDYEPHESATASIHVDWTPEAFKDHPELSSKGACVPLDIAQISACAKHRSALVAIASRANLGGYHMIIEDDVLFGENIIENLDAMLRCVPSDYDIVLCGLPSPSTNNNEVPWRCIPVDQLFNLIPACDSYVVNPLAATRFVAGFSPVRLAPHLTLSWVVKKHGLRAYASSPNVFADGSKVGVYVSQTSPDNRLIWNDQFAQLEALANGPIPKNEGAMRAAQDFINSLQFKSHPDILRLLGRLQLRLGNFADADAIFKQVYSIMVGEQCVLNAHSSFLRDYMILHKYVQTDI